MKEFPVWREFARREKVDPNGIKLFDIQNVTNMYWAGEKDDYDWRKDFGPLIPPFPVMWLESHHEGGKLGTTSFDAGIAVTTNSPSSPLMAPIIEAQRRDPDTHDREGVPFTIVTVRAWAIRHNGYFLEVPLMFAMAVDEQGRWMWNRYGDVMDEAPQGVQAMLESVLYPAMLAIGLVNCKNVDTEPRQTQRRGGKKSKRQPKTLDYHVIKLPRPSGGGGHGSGAGEPMAFHAVRGHFRTYTAERPLMGKRVGTYWFAAHVRGDARVGVSKATYEVRGDVL